MGLEKETLIKVITKSPENVSEFVKLSGTDGDAALQQARKLVYTLYDQQGKVYNYHHDLNKCMTRIAKQKDISLSKIPPCEASFLQHVKLAAWQDRVWKAAHVGFPDLATPFDFGWIQEQGMLSLVYYEECSASELIGSLRCECGHR